MDDHELARSNIEANTLAMFSVFFGVLAVLVLIGTLWATGKTATIVVSIASGVALLVVSGFAGFFSVLVRKKIDAKR